MGNVFSYQGSFSCTLDIVGKTKYPDYELRTTKRKNVFYLVNKFYALSLSCSKF